MQRDLHLVRELLVYLQKIEASKQPGDTLVLVQPSSQTLNVTNGFSIPGYSGEQVDDHLRIMIAERLIVGREEGWGIHFDRLTPPGQALLNKP